MFSSSKSSVVLLLLSISLLCSSVVLVNAQCGVVQMDVGYYTYSSGHHGPSYYSSYTYDWVLPVQVGNQTTGFAGGGTYGNHYNRDNDCSCTGCTPPTQYNGTEYCDLVSSSSCSNNLIALLLTMDWPGQSFLVKINGEYACPPSNSWCNSRWSQDNYWSYSDFASYSSYNINTTSVNYRTYCSGANDRNDHSYGVAQFIVMIGNNGNSLSWNCDCANVVEIISSNSGSLSSFYTSHGQNVNSCSSNSYSCTLESRTFTFNHNCSIHHYSSSSSTGGRAASSSSPRISASSSSGGHAVGDPQFAGFAGQNYQIHGTSGDVYNLISTQYLQMNALFDYRQSGRCPPQLKKRTLCWSHPGNYFAEVGMLFAPDSGVTLERAAQYIEPAFSAAQANVLPLLHVLDDSEIEWWSANPNEEGASELVAISGAYDVGMTIEWNHQELPVSNKWYALELATEDEQAEQHSVAMFALRPNVDTLYIISSEVVVRLENSDYFINYHEIHLTPDLKQRIQRFHHLQKDDAFLHATGSSSAQSDNNLSPDSFPHGLLGQTWQYKVYKNAIRYIEGTPADYIVEDGVVGTDFFFNHFGQYRKHGHSHASGSEIA